MTDRKRLEEPHPPASETCAARHVVLDDEDGPAAFLIEASRSDAAAARQQQQQLQQQQQQKAQHLSPEPQDGNIEYKARTGPPRATPLKLIAPTTERLAHLVTQLKWRIAEGGGEAIYEIGVEDDGAPTGLSDEELAASLATLRSMGEQLQADVTVLRTRQGVRGKVCEALVRQYSKETNEFLEVRVAVVGNVDAGKSTLLGVLTKGSLDNGRGLARVQIFRHKHEIESGRTSSIGQEILGFDSKGEVVNYPKAHGTAPSAQEVCRASCKIVSFIDLAGHERYLKTTLFGMTGHQPDFAMLMIGANMGVIGMTKEHLGISLALRVPVFVVITKIDMCPEHILKETLAQIKRILKSPGCRKIPIVVRTEDDVVVCARNIVSERLAPIFCVSNVSGQNLPLLRQFLNLLPSSRDWEQLAQEPLEMQIDSDWLVPGVGTVVSGTVTRGELNLDDPVLLGPDPTGAFFPVQLKSIHTKRIPVKHARAGQSASVAIKKIKRSQIRKGMVLLSPKSGPENTAPFACAEFEAEVLVLYHATTIAPNYEAVVHCNTVKQTARIISMDHELLRTGDKARVKFRFLYWPEYLTIGSRLIFREGRAKGIGRVVSVTPHHSGAIERAVKKKVKDLEGDAATKGPASAAVPAPSTAPLAAASSASENPSRQRLKQLPSP
eukprot:m51a1_g9951 putative gtp-binding protein 1 (666) ;mRNA; f:25239-27850